MRVTEPGGEFTLGGYVLLAVALLLACLYAVCLQR